MALGWEPPGTEQKEETKKGTVMSKRGDCLTDYTPTIRFHAIFFQYTCFGFLFSSVFSLTLQLQRNVL